jgi:two-component system response regulator GlrR
MPSGKLLIVDDDRNLLELIKMRLESLDYEVRATQDEEEAKKAVTEQVFDLAVIDLQLLHQDGISLMEELRLKSPELPVIILTAHGSIESAVEAIKRGAYTYLTKPFDARELALHIARALENRRLSSEINRLRELLSEKYDFKNIIAKSAKMRMVLESVSRIAITDSTVYIHGESGTGKESIAQAIHLASGRKDNAFVAVNCAAIPDTLLESVLFGHVKGAFTGAIKSSKGLFAQAHEGTIFLDEVGDVLLPTQAKLLRVLQERQFHPVGSEQQLEVDVRIIVATNKNLEDLVKQGLFREDLFYRIHVIPIELPPLRERREDIPLLVEHFIKKISEKMKRKVKGLTPVALQKLMFHDWPGNVRELENTIEYAVAMTTQDMITEELILPTKSSEPEDMVKPLKSARDAFEKTYLIQLLEITRGNVSIAAKMAGKYRADFYMLLKKHNLDPAAFKDQKQ